MASNPAPAKKSLNLSRGCDRSRLSAEALAAAYELLTPILQRALASPESSQRPGAEQRQLLAGGQKA